MTVGTFDQSSCSISVLIFGGGVGVVIGFLSFALERGLSAFGLLADNAAQFVSQTSAGRNAAVSAIVFEIK